MNVKSDRTIAALLRHTGTALVQRYAHLSSTHLKEAIEGVGRYGTVKEKKGVTKVDSQPNSEGMENGTETKTVTAGVNEEKEFA